MWIINLALSFFKKYRWYFFLSLLVTALYSSGWVGYQIAKGLYTDELEDQIAWYEQALQLTQKESEKLAEQSRKIETRTRVVQQEVIKYVEKHPELSNCELDADGLRLWNNEQ